MDNINKNDEIIMDLEDYQILCNSITELNNKIKEYEEIIKKKDEMIKSYEDQFEKMHKTIAERAKKDHIISPEDFKMDSFETVEMKEN